MVSAQPILKPKHSSASVPNVFENANLGQNQYVTSNSNRPHFN